MGKTNLKGMNIALALAVKWHKNQKYGHKPYAYHLEIVAEIATLFGFENDLEIMNACYLHDVLEDTDVTYGTIKDTFGKNVADIVYRVTDEKAETRFESKMKTYPKIKECWKATAVKLCDRIANINESLLLNNKAKIQMYLLEHDDFVSQLKTQDNSEKLEPLWKKLEYLIKKL
jgi:(p)ppGpp synthase/HD superfamily hydrolase